MKPSEFEISFSVEIYEKSDKNCQNGYDAEKRILSKPCGKTKCSLLLNQFFFTLYGCRMRFQLSNHKKNCLNIQF